MILHFSAAGVPISWSLTALYKDAYGVASCAASSWMTRCGTPQLILEISDKGDVKRSEIHWPDDKHKQRQHPEDFLLLQVNDATFHLSNDVVATAETEVRRLLVETGFFIPRAEWELRYPASALTSRRFAEFNTAYEAARAAGGKLQFETRWVPFMQTSPDWQPTFRSVEIDGRFVTAPIDPAAEDPTDGAEWPTKDDADAATRLLNSGWTFDEMKVLMADEPIDAQTATA